jgi:formylglycine-generating enzyme
MYRSSVAGMVRIAGGSYIMGSDDHYPEEAPAHGVAVDGFWIDACPVTNQQFSAFVAATGYRTLAESPPDPAAYPGILPHMTKPGSLVFTPTLRPVDLSNSSLWWRFEFGADWRHPTGPRSGIEGLENHPVVHVAYEDALAYTSWRGCSLPTEAEWEYAARGGLAEATYAWGNELQPQSKPLANYWQGQFPWQNLATEGFAGTSPVRAFPPNGYGLFDMIGNVWEWTTDWFEPRHPAPCCVPRNPRGAAEHKSYDPCTPDIRIPRRVLKGGSYLCAPNYCQRYRPAARYPQPIDTSTSHVGFRCVLRGTNDDPG